MEIYIVPSSSWEATVSEPAKWNPGNNNKKEKKKRTITLFNLILYKNIDYKIAAWPKEFMASASSKFVALSVIVVINSVKRRKKQKTKSVRISPHKY